MSKCTGFACWADIHRPAASSVNDLFPIFLCWFFFLFFLYLSPSFSLFVYSCLNFEPQIDISINHFALILTHTHTHIDFASPVWSRTIDAYEIDSAVFVCFIRYIIIEIKSIKFAILCLDFHFSPFLDVCISHSSQNFERLKCKSNFIEHHKIVLTLKSKRLINEQHPNRMLGYVLFLYLLLHSCIFFFNGPFY